MALLGPNGQPISSEHFRKGPSPALGPAYGDWAGRDAVLNQMPGGAILGFNLDQLTLADFRAMRWHPQVNASLILLWFMQHQIDWTIECDDKSNTKIPEQIEANMRVMWTQICRGMGQSFWAGYSPCALEFENNTRSKYIELTRVKDLYPEDCDVRWKEVEGAPAPSSSQAVSISPDYRWLNTEAGGRGTGTGRRPKFKEYDGIIQYGAGEIPVLNSFWYPVFMENGNYYGRKLLKAAFTPWYFSTLIHLFANRYFERFGEPVPVGRAPFTDTFTDTDGSTLSGKEVMENILRNLRNRSVVTLPSERDPVTKEFDYEIEYLESNMRGVDFDRYLERLDEEISLALFTPFLLMRSSSSASQGLGIQHTQTWLWMNNAVSSDMKEYIDAHIVNRLVDINFGPNAPRCRWVPKALGKENAETLRALAQELVRGRLAEPDLKELSDAVGISLKPGPGPEKSQPQQQNPVDGDGMPGPDGTKPRVDTRPRTDRSRATDQDRSVAEPRSTARRVSARVAQQVENAFHRSTWGASFRPDLGFHARFVDAFVVEGWPRLEAEAATDQIYRNMESWLETTLTHCADDYSWPREFMEMFDRKFDLELEKIAHGDD